MSALALTIPIAIVMGLAALVAFLWALKSGQYEDMEGASQRILDEDDNTRSAKSRSNSPR
jgi:cbb3-type cytochrome oxidase maturation protein